MNKKTELYMLSPENQKIVIDRLTNFSRKNEISINAFYFLYGIGKMLDNIKTGEEFYDYLQQKSGEFLYGDIYTIVDYTEKVKDNEDLYELGKRLVSVSAQKEIGAIFYNGKYKEELIEIFNKELF